MNDASGNVQKTDNKLGPITHFQSGNYSSSWQNHLLELQYAFLLFKITVIDTHQVTHVPALAFDEKCSTRLKLMHHIMIQY